MIQSCGHLVNKLYILSAAGISIQFGITNNSGLNPGVQAAILTRGGRKMPAPLGQEDVHHELLESGRNQQRLGRKDGP